MRLFADVASGVDDPYLARAVTLAERARGRTAPNPLVGCVVVRDGEIVGEGYHPMAGEPHAEIFALSAAGQHAEGADVYVTLEPCRHHGRTPPCTDALIAAGVRSVTVGMLDPTESAGGGIALLEAAGVTTNVAENPRPFAELNAGWLHRLRTGRPKVTAKVALSLDAKLALIPGERSDITGPSGAALTQRLRRASDAVLVGARTAVADDPALTLRDEAGTPAEHQPLRVVLLGETTRLPADARVLNAEKGPTMLLVPDTVALPPFEGTILESYAAARGLRSALERLGERGTNDLLVEPGARLFSALWTEGLIDELVTVTAGGLVGSEGLGLFDGDIAHANEALRRVFEPVEAGIVGDVSVVVWRPQGPEAVS